MSKSKIMRIKLSGGRFKTGELPFFILGDLVPLQDMVVDVAKWLFKEEHRRRRSPSSFDQTYLKIIRLRPGSIIAEIDIDTTRAILDGVPVPNQKHFEAAADRIVDVIRLAEQGAEHLNGNIPPRCMAYFNRVGRSLISNEIMEITATNKQTAHLTQQSREVLVRNSVGEIMRDITVRGVISEVDLKNMKFRLEPIYGPIIHCPFHEQHRETILGALNSYKNRTKMQVQVQMTGIYDVQDRLQRVESIRSVESLDPLDVGVRLGRFRNLRDGWLEDGGVAPDHKGLDWLSSVFKLYYQDDLQLPYTYPTAEGGVSLEWSAGTREIDIEVNIDDHTGEWYVFNKDSKRGEDEKSLNLDSPDDWQWMNAHLQKLMEKSQHDLQTTVPPNSPGVCR